MLREHVVNHALRIDDNVNVVAWRQCCIGLDKDAVDAVRRIGRRVDLLPLRSKQHTRVLKGPCCTVVGRKAQPQLANWIVEVQDGHRVTTSCHRIGVAAKAVIQRAGLR